ncbi:MAG: phage holin [Aminipila sp.]
MKINWKLRFKNPYFYIGLLGVILTAMGVSPESVTSWEIVKQHAIELLSNPYMLGSVLIAVIGVIHDPTTKGAGDSDRALTYNKPN